jgi:hypothetical protein
MYNNMKKAIRLVTATGQVSIGREIAGQEVQVIRQDRNTWIIKRGQFIPDSERWLYRDNNLEKLMKGVEWSENNPRRDNFKEIEERILSDD